MDRDQVVHDWLLANKPAQANHDLETCKFCKNTDQEKEQVAEGDKIFTQEQHEALLATAIEKAKVEAIATADAELLRLNERVSAYEQEAGEKDSKITELEAQIAAREEEDRLSALAQERVALVKAEANFSDEQIEARKAQWAKMSESDFKTYLEDIGTVAKASKVETRKPDGFDGTRQTAGENNSEVDVIKDFFRVAPLLAGKI